MAKQKQTSVFQGNFEYKQATQSKAYNYAAFGWVRSKKAAPAETAVKSKKEPVVSIRRRAGYAQDGILRGYETEYLKREKKKYRQLPILGIICFLLMIVFLAVAGVELYYGITQGLDRINYEGTYNYFDENGEKVDYPAFILTKDTWTYKTSANEAQDETGTITNKVTSLELYAAADEGEEADLVFIAIVSRGTLKIYDGANRGKTFFSEKSKLDEKFSEEKKAEEAAEAAFNADEEDEEADGEAAPQKGFLDKIRETLDKYHDEYVTKATNLLDGEAKVAYLDTETNEEVAAVVPNGFISNIAISLGAPIGCFISGDTVIAIVALILFIVVTIFFSVIAKKKSKRAKNEARKTELLNLSRARVETLRRSNPALMNKSQRKAFMWESIITNALRNAGVGASTSSSTVVINRDDDDDDLDFD